MYLSQLILNLHTPNVLAKLENPYDLHRTLLRAFPEQMPNDERVLYRLETSLQTIFSLPVLVQSLFQPDWSFLERDGVLLDVARVKQFEPKFEIGQVLAFRLLANPTKRLKQNGKRIGIYEEEGLFHWVERKAQQSGFDLLAIDIQKQGTVSAVKNHAQRKHSLNHFAVLFEGELRVRDSQDFTKAFCQGIGSGKGFGFGLLSVAPAYNNKLVEALFYG